jgi:hypothetical protein
MFPQQYVKSLKVAKSGKVDGNPGSRVCVQIAEDVARAGFPFMATWGQVGPGFSISEGALCTCRDITSLILR